MRAMRLSKADLHIHSHYSRDSFSSLPAILKRAKEQQLDIIAITDHHSIKGAKEAQKMAPEFGLEAIVGEEITSKEGDIIGLFIQDLIKPKKSVLETIKEIHHQGGLAIVPHPDNWFLGGIPIKIILEIFTQADGIELFNGSWVGRISQKKIKTFNKAIFNLAPAGGSDAHLARQVGCCYTLFPGKKTKDLYSALKEKKTSVKGSPWSYRDRFLWLVHLPRIISRKPSMPFVAFKRVFKKVF